MVSREDLQTTPLLLREPGSGTRDVVELQLGTLAPPAGEFGSLSAQRAAIGTMGAPAIMSARAVEAQVETGFYRAVPTEGVDLRRTITALWRGGEQLGTAATAFLAVLQSSAKANMG